MRKEVWYLGIALLLILFSTVLVFADDSVEVDPVNTSSHDKLTEILSRGSLVLAILTDSNDITVLHNTERDPLSKCTGRQYSKNQLSGERVDFSSKIAEELGVDACFVEVDIDEIRNGSWGDKWDYFLGYYITNERMKWLYFSQPVKASPSVFFIRSDNKNISSLKDLSGKTIGASNKTTQDDYLRNRIDIYGDITENPIENPIIMYYSSEEEMIDDLVSGKIDAILTTQISMKSKKYNASPVKQLEPYAFIGYSGPAIEKSNSVNPIPFVKKLNEIIQKMHKNGELTNLSIKYYDYDITKKAGEFDISSLNQFYENS